MASSTIIATGDGQIPLFNWHLNMDLRTCVQLSRTTTIASFIPAFFIPGSTGGTVGAGGDVASQLSELQGYVSNSSIAITPRLEAAQQVVDYLMQQYQSAAARYNYILTGSQTAYGPSSLQAACNWTNNYADGSLSTALVLTQEINALLNSWAAIRNSLSAAQQQTISNTQLEIQLNQQIAELNDMVAKAKITQDEARLKGLGTDFIRFGIPIAAAILIAYLIFKK